jgi:hypothetical protein
LQTPHPNSSVHTPRASSPITIGLPNNLLSDKYVVISNIA